MANVEEVTFKNLDGLTLHGTLYLAGLGGPCLIMTPGFNVTRATMLPQIAHYFQDHGISCLVYDPRTVGSSGGAIRNDIDPSQQVADYHDALAFLKTDGRVEPDQICFWGFSFSGTVALAAGALDKRAKAVIAACPLARWALDTKQHHGVMAKAMQDRESRLMGNSPFYLPMITDNGVNPAGFSSGFSDSEMDLVARAKSISEFEVDTTIQTYYNIVKWDPFRQLEHLSPTPVLLISAENDRISPMKDQTEQIYDKIKGPKQMHVVAKRGHLDVLAGDSFESFMSVQVAFIRQIFHVDESIFV